MCPMILTSNSENEEMKNEKRTQTKKIPNITHTNYCEQIQSPSNENDLKHVTHICLAIVHSSHSKRLCSLLLAKTERFHRDTTLFVADGRETSG